MKQKIRQILQENWNNNFFDMSVAIRQLEILFNTELRLQIKGIRKLRNDLKSSESVIAGQVKIIKSLRK